MRASSLTNTFLYFVLYYDYWGGSTADVAGGALLHDFNKY